MLMNINDNMRNALVSLGFVVVVFVFFAWSTVFSNFANDTWPRRISSEGKYLDLIIEVYGVDIKNESAFFKVKQGRGQVIEENVPSPENACISGMDVSLFYQSEYLNLISYYVPIEGLPALEPVCVPTSPAENIERDFIEFSDQSQQFQIIHNEANFPYDDIVIDLGAGLGVLERSGPEPPNVDWELNFEGWSLGKVDDISNAEMTRIAITLQRPAIFRFGFPLLIVSSLVLILTLFFLHEVSDLAQVGSGILFGLFGIRQVLVPQEVNWTTLVDFALVIIYVLLFLTLSIRIFLILKSQKQKSNSSQGNIQN